MRKEELGKLSSEFQRNFPKKQIRNLSTTKKNHEPESKSRQILKRINWDYSITNEDIEAVINGEQKHAGHWNYNKLLIRALETLSWYELLEVVGKEQLKIHLVPEILSKLRNSDMQEKYERIGKILRGESVSFTRWDPEYCQKLRDTFFSDRWYST